MAAANRKSGSLRQARRQRGRDEDRANHIFIVGVLLALTAILFLFNRVIGGYIINPFSLATELDSPILSPQDWRIADIPPFRYRALFRWLTLGVHGVTGVDFYWVYIGLSFALFFTAFLALYALLRALSFGPKAAVAGCFLFAATPPVSLAYLAPTHSREEPLAYLLMTFGVLAMVRRKPAVVGVCSVLGGLTRETALVLPLAYMVASGAPFRTKAIVALSGLTAVAATRLLLGYESYDMLQGWRWNAAWPAMSVYFAGLIFGAAWLPGLLGTVQLWQGRAVLGERWRMLVLSAPIVLATALAGHIIFGRLIEIRIAFIAFPWVLPIVLWWLANNRERFQAMATDIESWFWMTTLAMLGLAFYVTVTSSYGDHLRQHLITNLSPLWLLFGIVHAVLAILAFMGTRQRFAKGQKGGERRAEG